MKRKNTIFNLCLLLAALILFLGIRSAKAFAVTETTIPDDTNQNISNRVFIKENGFTYTIIHQIVVENRTKQTAKNIQIKIPVFSEEQPVYQNVQQVEYNPQPEKFLTDEQGNRSAVYILDQLAPGEKKILEQRLIVENYKGTYRISAGEVSSDYQNYAGIDPRYLQPEPGIESDHKEIIQYAKNTIGNETNPYLIARKLFADVNLYLTYKEGENANRGALNALRTGEGVCQEYTNLFVAALRSVGIPARIQVGYLYNSTQHIAAPYVLDSGYLNGDLLSHTWAEFYLPEIGWVMADPTFTYTVQNGEKEIKLVDWSHFGKIAAERNYLFWSEQNTNETSGSYSYTDAPVHVEFHSVIALGNRYSPFTDIGNHWARGNILALSQDHILFGKETGYFGVNDLVTREELAAVLIRVLSATNQVRSDVQDGGFFSDVEETHWAYSDIVQATQKGFFYGYPDGTFGVGKPVTRGEMAAMVVRLFQLQDNKLGGSVFTDLDLPGYQWAKQDIITLEHKNLVSGKTKDTFAPQENLTRGEMAAFIAQALYSSK